MPGSSSGLSLLRVDAGPAMSSGDMLFTATSASKTVVGTVLRRLVGRRRRSGSTLVEVVVSTMLVGVMLVAAMKAVGAVFRTRVVASQLHKANLLAQELMAEIIQAQYEDPDDPPTFGLESGESGAPRSDFDDVDDYDGWVSLPPEAKDGTPLTGYTGWQRRAEVLFVSPDNPTGEEVSETGLKWIRVYVTPPGGDETELHAYRAVNGVLEQVPPLDTTYVTGVVGELQIGARARLAVGGTSVINHAEEGN